MVKARVWALLSAICPNISLFFAIVVLRLASRMLRMMIARVWVLLSAIFPISLALFY